MTASAVNMADYRGPGEGMAKRPRMWVPVTLMVFYWVFFIASWVMEMSMFVRFMSQSIVMLVTAVIFLVWWVFNRRVKLGDRFLVLGAAAVSPVVAVMLAHRTIGGMVVFFILPLILLVWTIWMVVAKKASPKVWKWGLIGMLFVPSLVWSLFRMEGLAGAGVPDLRFRWSETAEQRYLAQHRAAPATRPASAAGMVALKAGDWPGFRGPNRDGVVRGISIETNWNEKPPKQVWKRQIGPGWSSMTIVDGRLFTQEQRGDVEAVVCVNAQSGEDIWSFDRPGRFDEPQSAIGPRATPTFDNGKIYALGASGLLVCLDAGSGQKIWERNVLEDSGSKLPGWGLASSPLVTHGVVVVYAKENAGKGLLAYKVDSGDIAWTADAGNFGSYSSPHLANIGGEEQILFQSDTGMLAVNPADGKKVWDYALGGFPARSVQPLLVAPGQILVSWGLDAPVDLIEVSKSGSAYSASKKWTSKNLKSSFNDCVLYEGHIYGFDGVFFSCIDAKTGERNWRKGRYGTGQVMLLADQGVLVVLSDKGKVVAVAVRPDEFEELGQFQAIEGKTWNHPAMVGNKLYVRNAAEMACYELTAKGPQTRPSGG